jgi:hypothetical protein
VFRNLLHNRREVFRKRHAQQNNASKRKALREVRRERVPVAAGTSKPYGRSFGVTDIRIEK